MGERAQFGRGRGALFVSIALGVPLFACNLLSRSTEGDAGAATATTEEPPAIVPGVAPSTGPVDPAAAAVTPPLASASGAAVATATPAKVAVKLPDGGTTIVDATVSPDGAVQLPPAFQFPTLPVFDAGALKVPAFDAAAIKLPPGLPSTFPAIPGFGAVAADSGHK